MKKLNLNERTKFIAYTALFTALVTAVTVLLPLRLPNTHGYINIGDAFIFVAAYFLGPIPALIAGGIGSCAADLILGYAVWVPFTLVIKGLEGFLAGVLIKLLKKSLSEKLLLLFGAVSMVLAGLVMVMGYFFASWILYGIATASLEVLMNLIQMSVSAGIAIAVVSAAVAAKIVKKNKK